MLDTPGAGQDLPGSASGTPTAGPDPTAAAEPVSTVWPLQSAPRDSAAPPSSWAPVPVSAPGTTFRTVVISVLAVCAFVVLLYLVAMLFLSGGPSSILSNIGNQL